MTSGEEDGEGSKGKERVCEGCREMEERIWRMGDGEKGSAALADVALEMEGVGTVPAGKSVKI